MPPDSENFTKNREKREKDGKNQKKSEKNEEKEEKLGRKGKNRESSFTLPLLTDTAGYATAIQVTNNVQNVCIKNALVIQT